MIIKRLDKVHYLSTKTSMRAFHGVVEAVYGDRAVVRHETEPKWVTLPLDRLVKL